MRHPEFEPWAEPPDQWPLPLHREPLRKKKTIVSTDCCNSYVSNVVILVFEYFNTVYSCPLLQALILVVLVSFPMLQDVLRCLNS